MISTVCFRIVYNLTNKNEYISTKRQQCIDFRIFEAKQVCPTEKNLDCVKLSFHMFLLKRRKVQYTDSVKGIF